MSATLMLLSVEDSRRSAYPLTPVPPEDSVIGRVFPDELIRDQGGAIIGFRSPARLDLPATRP